ncbi:hypothetical protein ACFLV7_12890 [Chloroflexota bacterium]
MDNIDVFVDAAERGNVTYFNGDGRIAATASISANDISINTLIPGAKQIISVSLVDNIAVLTAVALMKLMKIFLYANLNMFCNQET